MTLALPYIHRGMTRKSWAEFDAAAFRRARDRGAAPGVDAARPNLQVFLITWQEPA